MKRISKAETEESNKKTVYENVKFALRGWGLNEDDYRELIKGITEAIIAGNTDKLK